MATIDRPLPDRPLPRVLGFAALLTIALVAIVTRLVQVQLVQGYQFAAAARANQIQVIPVAAPRGLIVDKRGTVLVRSRPSFVCALIPSEVVDIDKTLAGLADVLHIPVEKLRHRMLHHHQINYDSFEQVRTYEPNGPVILATELTAGADRAPGRGAERSARHRHGRAAGAQLPLRQAGLAPLRLRRRDRRGRVQAPASASGYSPNDVVGKDGLENAYDRWLHGRAGGQQVEVERRRASSCAGSSRSTRCRATRSSPPSTARLQRIVEQQSRRRAARSGAKRAGSGSRARSS